MTEEHDTVEEVNRDANAEDEGSEVAYENIFYDGESLKGNNIIGVVPRNKVVYVSIVFAVSTVHLTLHLSCSWQCPYCQLCQCHLAQSVYLL